jgi:hypothetical protein
MSHDASATWSGFNYQGKVALYHTLTVIIHKLRASEEFDFSDYELILENHEDFDIKDPNGFISFHQVKAMNETAFNRYENALFAMLLQLDAPVYESVIGYLHTWKPLSWNGSVSFEQKLRSVIKKVIDNHDADPKQSIIQKAFTESTNPPKMTKILRQAKKEDDRLADVNSVEELLDQAYTSTDSGCVVKRVKQYDYDGKSACDINDIDQKVKDAIGEVHNILRINSNANALDKIFCVLLAKLDNNVILKHSNLSSDGETPIPFTDIIDIISSEEIRDSDEAYLASRFKLQFIKAFEEFIDDEDLCSPTVAEAYSNRDSNLNKVMELLFNLSSIELLHHFKRLNPHVAMDTGNTIDTALLVNMDNLKQYLFSIFREMCDTNFIHNKREKLVLYKNGRKRYLPTTIGAQTKRSLVTQIMNNSHAISSLFETTAMISGCEHANEIHCFAEQYSNVTGTSVEEFYVDEAPKEKEKISQISRDIRLIRVSTAIQEINDA